jgi:hypothetical protein
LNAITTGYRKLWLQQLYVRIDITSLRKKQGIKQKRRRGNSWARKARDKTTAFFYDKHRRKVNGRERLIERYGTGSSVGTHCLNGASGISVQGLTAHESKCACDLPGI